MSIIKSVERSLEVLDILTKYPYGIGVTELAHQLDVAKSTVHRILTTLHEKQYVRKDLLTDKYRLGTHILYLSSYVLENFNIRDIARKKIEELSKVTKETVHLCILDFNEIVYIDKVESNHTIRLHSRIGKRAPVHCTAVGKAILGHLSSMEARKILLSTELKPFTKNTITDVEKMMEELAKIKANGYSIDEIENEEGIRCVAAPILDHNNYPVAVISISGPTSRITKQRVQKELVKLLKEASAEISKELGSF